MFSKFSITDIFSLWLKIFLSKLPHDKSPKLNKWNFQEAEFSKILTCNQIRANSEGT